MSLVGFDEVVYSKKIPNAKNIRFAKDETTGKLYFVVDGVYMDVTSLNYKTLSDKASMPVIEYNEVDLDLPSGLKWSDRNVGAETPQGYGMYFSWGNTDGVLYTRENMLVKDVLYKYAEIAGVPESQVEEIMSQEGWEEMVKTELSGIGIIEGTTFDETAYSSTSGGQFTGETLDAEHDAVTQWIGNGWRMPTSAETNELYENTQHYYIGLDGTVVAGPFDYNTSRSDKGLDGSPLRSICFVKLGETFNTDIYQNQDDLTNKYFIEIPFAGYCLGSLLDNEGLNGFVWSRSVVEGYVQFARSLNFNSGGDLYGYGYFDFRFGGRSVRGVRA